MLKSKIQLFGVFEIVGIEKCSNSKIYDAHINSNTK